MATTTTTDEEFSADERAAMKQRAAELRKNKTAAARGKKIDGSAEMDARIAEMDPADRAIAERIRVLIAENVPGLEEKTWYGFPSWAIGGKVVFFFQPASKFKTRYSTLGFQDLAKLDDGAMWATSFAITELRAADEARIIDLVTRATEA